MQNRFLRFIIVSIVFNVAFSKFPDAVSTNGMVVSSHALASAVGVAILQQGGNAVDAAVAVGFALAVVHPGAGNIGGGGFMVIRFSDGSTTSIDFRETAPGLANKNMFLDEKGEVIKGKSWQSALAVGTPGTVAGLGYAHEKYGTQNWYRLLQPAVKLARYGHKTDYLNLSLLNSNYYREFLSNDIDAI